MFKPEIRNLPTLPDACAVEPYIACCVFHLFESTLRRRSQVQELHYIEWLSRRPFCVSYCNSARYHRHELASWPVGSLFESFPTQLSGRGGGQSVATIGVSTNIWASTTETLEAAISVPGIDAAKPAVLVENKLSGVECPSGPSRLYLLKDREAPTEDSPPAYGTQQTSQVTT